MSLTHIPRSVSSGDVFPTSVGIDVDVDDATEEEVHAERSDDVGDFRFVAHKSLSSGLKGQHLGQ